MIVTYNIDKVLQLPHIVGISSEELYYIVSKGRDIKAIERILWGTVVSSAKDIINNMDDSYTTMLKENYWLDMWGSYQGNLTIYSNKELPGIQETLINSVKHCSVIIEQYIEDKNQHKTEGENKMIKARFADAQIDDLVWNDDLGLCRITRTNHQDNYPIAVERTERDGLIDCLHSFTFEGKRLTDSPKATLYYYSEEDPYLTERPTPKVAISGLSEGYCPCGQYLSKAFSLFGSLVNTHDGARQFVDVPCPNDKCDRTYTVWVKK